jgi:arylsulfatase A-like enzyme
MQMSHRLNRRDFLKLASSLPLGFVIPPLAKTFQPLQPLQGSKKNVLIIVFDAWSAYHLPIYGYSRNTTPNISRLAERAIVYHNHYAGGNFTTPGTASLLTGTLPWSHRAFQHYGTVTEAFVNQNIFQAFKNHYRVAYSHNPLANVLLRQFSGHLNDYVPMSNLMLTTDGFLEALFENDEDIASVAWTRTVKKQEEGLEGHSYSLFLSELYQRYQEKKVAVFKPFFPRGIPNIKGDNFFLLEDAIDWLQEQVNQFPRPYMGYFHFMPPHAPCNTHRDFYEAFKKDGFKAPSKPEDIFSDGNSYEELLRRRVSYDEFILYLDREFARLFDYLESSGVLDDTWVVLTADHGELFERGIRGHTSPLLYQPVVRIPLMIFEPGRTSRSDVYASTSAVDVLPTLLHVTGEPPPAWTEGTLLPPFSATEPQPERAIYSLNAKSNDPATPLTHATAMIVSGSHKLVYFFGYKELGKGVERVELYDIESDPEELNDLYAKQKDTGANLLHQLKEKLKEVNQPYI